MNKSKRKQTLTKLAREAKLNTIVKEAQQAVAAGGASLGDEIFARLVDKVTDEVVDELLDDAHIPES